MPHRTPLAGDHIVSARDQGISLPEKGSPESPAMMPVPQKSKPVPEKNPAMEIVPLKNGAGYMRIASARRAQEDVSFVLREDPKLFTALYALAEGRDGEVSREQRQELMEWETVATGGKLRPDIKAVMLAGYRDTPAGPVMTEPLDLSNPEHAAIVEQLDKEEEASSRRGRVRFRLEVARRMQQDKNKGDDGDRGR
jgi:hypothetical protein